jgi:hypothetical protein
MTYYEFHIANIQCKNRPTELTPYESTASDKDETDDDDLSHNEESADNEEGKEELLEEIEQKEKEILELAKHVKEAASMRKMAQYFTKEAKDHSANDKNHGSILCDLADYGRNMEMPFFGSEQPGGTYYYMPKTVNNFGIVNVAPVKEVLNTYVYYGWSRQDRSWIHVLPFRRRYAIFRKL